jgi:hypothetical protein
MRTAVKVITGISLLGIAVGGSMLDSQSLVLPMLMIVPSMAWLSLLGWVNAHD